MVVDNAGVASKLKSGAVEAAHTSVVVATASNENVTDVVGLLAKCPDSETSSKKPVAAS